MAQGHAPAFAKAGAKALILVARNAYKLNSLAAELNKLYPKVETLILPTDIVDSAQVKGLFEKIGAAYVCPLLFLMSRGCERLCAVCSVGWGLDAAANQAQSIPLKRQVG